MKKQGCLNAHKLQFSKNGFANSTQLGDALEKSYWNKYKEFHKLVKDKMWEKLIPIRTILKWK